MRLTRCGMATIAAAATLGVSVTLAGCSRNAPAPNLTVLSSSPNLVSGGDTLVSVAVPAGWTASELVVTLNGANVAGRFQPDPQTPSQLIGLVTGLHDGATP